MITHPAYPTLLLNAKQSLALLMTALALLAAPAASAVAVGDKAPDCELSALGAGQAGKLSQYKGKVVYVDFWASWCGPCAQSFPFLNELHKQLGGQGLQIVGVNMDENADDANTFLAKIPASFPVAADASKQCAKDFDVQAMPSSYIIDNKGVVHHIHLGFRPGAADELQSTIQGLLSAK